MTPTKIAPRKPIDYLERDELEAVLAAIDRSKGGGLRDYALFALIYNCGNRVHETLELNACDLHWSAQLKHSSMVVAGGVPVPVRDSPSTQVLKESRQVLELSPSRREDLERILSRVIAKEVLAAVPHDRLFADPGTPLPGETGRPGCRAPTAL